LNYLKEAKGRKSNTVYRKISIIVDFEDFIDKCDFEIFNEKIAMQYKSYLNDSKWKGEPISKKTALNKLTTIKDFYIWLKKQKGYKSKINESDIEYLNLDLGTMHSIRTTQALQQIPDIVHVGKLIDSIEIENDVDKRDKALIAFMLLSGMRIGSIISIKLKDFDKNKLTITINTMDGRNSKFGKANIVRLLVFDSAILEPIIEWFNYLVGDRGFNLNDPLFPMTDVKNIPDGNVLQANNVKPEFWKRAGAINKILKDRAANANLQYYRPHLFRGLHTSLALSMAKDGKEILAISRNLGHNSVNTTISFYGYMDFSIRIETLSKIDFEKRRKENSDDIGEKVSNMMENLLKRMDKLEEKVSSNRKNSKNK